MFGFTSEYFNQSCRRFLSVLLFIKAGGFCFFANITKYRNIVFVCAKNKNSLDTVIQKKEKPIRVKTDQQEGSLVL